MTIPRPTEKELERGNKVDYFDRLIGQDYHRKHKMELS